MTRDEFIEMMEDSIECKRCKFEELCDEDGHSETPAGGCGKFILKLVENLEPYGFRSADGGTMHRIDGSIPTENYKDRMASEYRELKEKYTRLHKILIKHEAGTLEFEPDTPIYILQNQASVMGEYLRILEVRAEIENVKL